jgi:hypothetical protein
MKMNTKKIFGFAKSVFLTYLGLALLTIGIVIAIPSFGITVAAGITPVLVIAGLILIFSAWSIKKPKFLK